jgi:hypothetical protein
MRLAISASRRLKPEPLPVARLIDFHIRRPGLPSSEYTISKRETPMSLSVRSSIVAQTSSIRRISRSRAIRNHSFATIAAIKLVHRPQRPELMGAGPKPTLVGAAIALADH